MGELIVHGKTGFLIEAGNQEKMAERIMELLENESLRQEMGRQARSQVENHFSFTRVTHQLTQWLDSL